MPRCRHGLRRAICATLALTGIVTPTILGAQGCASERRARLTTALEQGYGVQYWGDTYTADALSDQPHGLLILELTRWSEGPEDRFSGDEIARIRHGGTRPVLAYLNVTEVEPFRDYYPDDGTPLPAWWGVQRATDHLAAYWTSEWRSLLEDRVDALMARGVDGIFLDDALHYYTHMQLDPDADARAYPVALMELVTALAGRMRQTRCEALMVVNNAVFVGRDAGPDHAPVFDAYRDAIDGILVENAMGPDGASDTRTALAEDYAQRGIAVLTLDVAPPDARDDRRGRARSLGFIPYTVEDDSFSRLFPPAPAD